MTLQALKDELTNDPLGRGYSGMSDEAAADSLNTANRSCLEPISSAELLAWSGNGATDGSMLCRYERIQEAAAASASNTVRGACIAALGMIERDGTSLDLNKPDRMAMLDALVAGGVLTAAEKTSLLALATITCSRAVELGLSFITPSLVADAKRLP
jgi:hypothetical protein